MGKEKINQIFEAMADITLTRLKKIKEEKTLPGSQDFEMVSATLNLYLATSDNSEQDLFEDSPFENPPYESVKSAFESL